jgi:hypothetical protein
MQSARHPGAEPKRQVTSGVEQDDRSPLPGPVLLVWIGTRAMVSALMKVRVDCNSIGCSLGVRGSGNTPLLRLQARPGRCFSCRARLSAKTPVAGKTTGMPPAPKRLWPGISKGCGHSAADDASVRSGLVHPARARAKLEGEQGPHSAPSPSPAPSRLPCCSPLSEALKLLAPLQTGDLRFGKEPTRNPGKSVARRGGYSRALGR